MTEQKNKIFPFGWVLLVLVILATTAWFLYVSRFKGDRKIYLHAQRVTLIDKHEHDSTVNAFIKFVNNSSNKMDLDHVYTNTALLKLSAAISAMAKASGYIVETDLNSAETAANKITRDPLAISHADNIRKAADILSEALINLQKAKYPSLSVEASSVVAAAREIDPDVMTLNQKTKVKLFLQKAAELLEKMN